MDDSNVLAAFLLVFIVGFFVNLYLVASNAWWRQFRRIYASSIPKGESIEEFGVLFWGYKIENGTFSLRKGYSNWVNFWILREGLLINFKFPLISQPILIPWRDIIVEEGIDISWSSKLVKLRLNQNDLSIAVPETIVNKARQNGLL